ncbi:hypothetical protein [Acinetobacter nectaris]|uniref:hypothetical protein n=1 Tax=Acinetobacter nectaris TaxID=1219382 RepID=UPI001F1DD3BF|nr:hypothetical protein [Acinetobacter nectaris]MCF9033345.1 hypothetical protein [Acinetobacter nectaris]
MIKFNRKVILFISSLVFASTSVFAEDMIDYDGKPEQKIIYPVNGNSGFVFNKLKSVFPVKSQGYNTIIVDSSSMPSAAQIKQLQAYLNQGVTLVIDAKASMGTAQAVAQKIAGFSVNSEAIMIKSSNGGYDVTPVSSNIYESKATATDSDTSSRVANTVDDVFGL